MTTKIHCKINGIGQIVDDHGRIMTIKEDAIVPDIKEEEIIDTPIFDLRPAEFVADQLFDLQRYPDECEAIKCVHYGGPCTPQGTGFNCAVFEKELEPHHCPLTRKQMIQLYQSLDFWVEANILDAEKPEE